MSEKKIKKVRIVGAGFSGLTLAYFLSKSSLQIELYEQNSDAGGLIATIQTPLGIVETAANAFVSSALLENLADEIGVSLIQPQSSAKKRYIFTRGKYQRWPLTIWESIKFVFRLIFIKSKCPHESETVYDWGLRAIGPAATEHILTPALKGIYAGDTHKMSAKLVLGRFFESQSKTKVKAKNRGSVAPLKGMSSFIEAIKFKLKNKANVALRFNEKIDASTVKKWCEEKSSSTVTIIATRMPQASVLINELCSPLSTELSAQESIDLSTATIFYPKDSQKIKGFGVLFHQQRRIVRERYYLSQQRGGVLQGRHRYDHGRVRSRWHDEQRAVRGYGRPGLPIV
jgi:oxygen-dependent protoporphyrinogen oxidase